MAGPTVIPCSSKKLFVQSTGPNRSLSAISSASADDLDTSFCFIDSEWIFPCVNDIPTPLSDLRPLWAKDYTKLNRLLKYINGTKDLVLTPTSTNPMVIRASIDAAYGVHNDHKSESVLGITLTHGNIHSDSIKQS